MDEFDNFSVFSCRKFVSGLRAFDDQRALLFEMDPSGTQAPIIEKLIKRVLSEGADDPFLDLVVCPFFIWLSSSDLEKGTCRPIRDKLVSVASETPGLLNFVQARWSNITDPEKRRSVAWFAETVVRLNAKQWRDSAEMKGLANVMQAQFDDIFVSSSATRILAILTGAQDPLQQLSQGARQERTYTLSMEDYKAITPGGRHDNDKTDYREINIVPTSEEICSEQQPFLPTPEDKWPMLDRLFRLMREDMVASLKEKIKILVPTGPSKTKKRPVRGYSPALLGGIEFDKFHTWSFKIYFSLPDNHPTKTMKKKKDKEEYWDFGRGKKTLTRFTVVMVSHVDTPHRPLLIGEVVTRNTADLASETPWIGARFADRASLKRAISLARSPPPGDLMLIPVNIALFMYSPVLSRLKSMPLVPFMEELDDQTPLLPGPANFASDFSGILNQLNYGVPPVVQGLEGTLDPGQLEGAKMALQQRVTLIQGPPGTGKTYIGTYIAKLLTNSPRPLKILCVTYTNHAVDDFCEGLLKCGITRLVRLGSRPSTPAVEEYTLSKWKERVRNKAKNMVFNRRYASVMATLDEEKFNAGLLLSQSQGHQGSMRSRWPDIKEYLDQQGNGWVEELTLRDDPSGDDGKDENGWKTAGKKGEKITEDYLWHKWLNGDEKPKVSSQATFPKSSCWSLQKDQRLAKATKWIDAIDEDVVNRLSSALLRVDDALADKENLSKETDYIVLEQMQVILCTTTAAAKNSDLLKAAQCDVVLVEEAGEILETHVLSSIYEDAKALIMIGDHLQLRPKVESYGLRFESGKGYNLNISLFERLVKNGYPCATLTTQHRMHPDISRLIRPTYPELKDSPAVSLRDPVKGFQAGVRVAFVSHTHLEGANDQSMDDTSVSYTNEFEADMVVKIVNYFQRQGYANDQLVVLTPYLGQLRILMDKLKGSIVSGRDANDLRQLDPDADAINAPKPPLAGATKQIHQKPNNVRVSSIDNYQGEESDIVIISLVRNNAIGKMGFVGDANRINVLFSRARCGMVILGCAAFLTSVRDVSAKSRWKKFLDMFEEKGQLFDHFPAFCASHNKELHLVAPTDFDKLSPQGGCDEPCGVSLKCGHQCSLKCHPSDREHAKVTCYAKNRWICPTVGSHVETYECGASAPSYCSQCKRIEAARIEFELKQEQERAKRAQMQADLDAQVAESKRHLEEEQQRHRDELQKLEKQQEIERIQIEQEKQRESTRALKIQVAEERSARLEEIRRTAELKLAEQTGIFGVKKMQLERQEELLKEQESEAAQIAGAAMSASSGNFEAFSSKLSSWDGSMTLKVANSLSSQIGAAASDMFDPARFALAVDPTPVSNIISLISKGDFIQARKIVKPELDKISQNPAGKPKGDFYYLALDLCDLKISSSKSNIMKDMLSKMRVANVTIPTDPSGPQYLNPAAPFYLIVRAIVLDAYVSLSSSAEKELRQLAAEAATLASTFLRLPKTVLDSLFPQAYWVDTAARLFKQHGSALGDIMSGSSPSSGSSSSDAAKKLLTPDQELKQEWEKMKRDYGIKSKSMDTLIDMAALRNLKRQLMSIVNRVVLEKRRGSSIKEIGYNLRFEGNPGTGKTTVAELYAGLLADLGVIKGDAAAKQEFDQKQAQQQAAAQQQQQLQQQQQAQAQQQWQQQLNNSLGMAIPLPPSLTQAAAPPQQPPAPKPTTPKSFIETSGAELVDEGVKKLKDQLKQIEEVGGGVLFVDEAYMLDPRNSGPGKQVLNYLLAEMEKRRGSLIVVFAGYKEKLEDLFTYNEGLPSRFSATVAFEDYDDEQLYDIFIGIMKKKTGMQPLKFEDNNDHWSRVAIRRLGAGRNAPGFGNGRSVRKLFDTVSNRQADRLAKNPMGDAFAFVKDDLLGPSPADAAKSSKAWNELRTMIGLSKVKESVASLYEVVKTNEILEHEMRPRQEVALNRIFLGNPGTGKTTVAKIYGQILRDFGLLSKGDILLKAASDFIGSVLGESQKNALAILKQAEGSVLVIDEAYGLHGKDPYKQSVIDTIVEQVQAVPGEDKCVVMLGYREQMETMLRESNPGLQRRFQLENAFQFDDFSNAELLEIMKLKMSKMDLEADADSLTAAIDALAVLRDTKPPFGNGGAVANLLSEAISRKAARKAGVDRKLIATDFAPPDNSGADLDEAVLFKGLIGCDEIINTLKGYKATVQYAKQKGQDPLQKLSLNFRFVGAPGTGKTTVASRMGRMFRALGVLPSADVVMASGTDLVGSFVGQTAPKTREMMDKGLGKVLFIDEAYSLAGNSGSFGQEAIDELVRCLTTEKYMNRMVVIVAGYENDIDRLMKANDGLRSRFEQVVHFRPFNLEESCRLLQLRLASPEVDVKLSSNVLSSNIVQQQMQRLTDHARFSNGRDTIAWAKKIERSVAMRSSSSDDEPKVTEEDLVKTMDEMMASMSTAQAEKALPVANPAVQTQMPDAPKAPSIKIKEDIAIEKPKEKEKEQPPVAASNDDDNNDDDYYGMKISTELTPLNNVLEGEMGLNCDQVDSLSNDSAGTSAHMQEAARKLSQVLGDLVTAVTVIKKWQEAKKKAEEERRKAEEAIRQALDARVPIVQCQVCGRTAEYWAPCYVAPKIIGYRVEGKGYIQGSQVGIQSSIVPQAPGAQWSLVPQAPAAPKYVPANNLFRIPPIQSWTRG